MTQGGVLAAVSHVQGDDGVAVCELFATRWLLQGGEWDGSTMAGLGLGGVCQIRTYETAVGGVVQGWCRRHGHRRMVYSREAV